MPGYLAVGAVAIAVFAILALALLTGCGDRTSPPPTGCAPVDQVWIADSAAPGGYRPGCKR